MLLRERVDSIVGGFLVRHRVGIGSTRDASIPNFS